MKVVLLVLLFLCILILLCALFVLVQYRRYQKANPKPDYKLPLHHLQPVTWPNDQVTVGWIGHSTLLMNILGKTVLTDPVFSKRAGVSVMRLFTIGPKRHTAPALSVDELPAVDVLLLSHAHMDHFDFPSLRAIARNPLRTVITASGTRRLFQRLRFSSVTELSGTESLTLPDGMCVSAVPVKHWGNRFPWNKGYGYIGYLLEYKGVRVFFAGDTAYTESFALLRESGPIDIACIPIGAYSPDSYQRAHCTPEQAWQMFLDSGAKWLVPIHFDTFVLSQEPVEEPLARLLTAAGEEAWRIVIREHGEIFQLPPKI